MKTTIQDNTPVFVAQDELSTLLDNPCHAFVESLVRLLSLRDIETERHTRRVAALSLDLSRASRIFSKAELLRIYQGALLHDVGKIGIPDSILHKREALTSEEEAFIHMHPIYAHELFRSLPCLKPLLDIAYCHHEKWDGTGYPRGLKGEEIPMEARIFAVTDVWDALTSKRQYHTPWSIDQAFDYITQQSERQFDPFAVKLFMKQYFHFGALHGERSSISYVDLQKKADLFMGGSS